MACRSAAIPAAASADYDGDNPLEGEIELTLKLLPLNEKQNRKSSSLNPLLELEATIDQVAVAGGIAAGDQMLTRVIRQSVLKQTKKKKKSGPFAPITDDPELPRVLLIGDSLSFGYTLPVREITQRQGKRPPPADQLRANHARIATARPMARRRQLGPDPLQLGAARSEIHLQQRGQTRRRPMPRAPGNKSRSTTTKKTSPSSSRASRRPGRNSSGATPPHPCQMVPKAASPATLPNTTRSQRKSWRPTTSQSTTCSPTPNPASRRSGARQMSTTRRRVRKNSPGRGRRRSRNSSKKIMALAPRRRGRELSPHEG